MNKKNMFFKTAAAVAVAAQGLLANIAVNAQNFPDSAFRAYVLTLCDSDSSIITDSRIEGITEIDVNTKEIENLVGIEHFTALQVLDCGTNKLTALDVSKNTELTQLVCGINRLTALDVSKNTALTRLVCESNQLTVLDVSKNTALSELYCRENKLTVLDLSENPRLELLYCGRNPLTALDVSKNTRLDVLHIVRSRLTALDVSKNTELTQLVCEQSQLTTLDLSKNTKLLTLMIRFNYFTDENKIIGLKELKPQIDTNHFSFEPQYVYFADSNFMNAVFEKIRQQFPNATTDKIQVDQVNKMDSLDVSGKNIKDFAGIEYFNSLKNLNCSGNQLTALDVSQNTELQILNCSNNRLKTLHILKDVGDESGRRQRGDGGASQLVELNASNNQLTALSVAGLIELTSLDVSNNKLATLSVSGLINLTSLDVSGNCIGSEDDVLGLRDLNLGEGQFVFGKQTTPVRKAAVNREFRISFAGVRNGRINLNLKAGNYVVELYSVSGRLIDRANISATDGLNSTGLKTDNLAKGMFVLNLKQGGASLLKQKVRI